MSSPADTLRAYLRAYEARDLPAIAALLSEDVRLQDWNLVAQGKAAVLAETRANFEAARSLRIELLRCYESGTQAAAELRITVNAEIVLEVVDAVRVNTNGQIEAIRAYKG